MRVKQGKNRVKAWPTRVGYCSKARLERDWSDRESSQKSPWFGGAQDRLLPRTARAAASLMLSPGDPLGSYAGGLGRAFQSLAIPVREPRASFVSALAEIEQ